MVVADEASFCVLSTGEKCAVALVLDRTDLAKWWGTMLDCADRVGPEWVGSVCQGPARLLLTHNAGGRGLAGFTIR